MNLGTGTQNIVDSGYKHNSSPEGFACQTQPSMRNFATEKDLVVHESDSLGCAQKILKQTMEPLSCQIDYF